MAYASLAEVRALDALSDDTIYTDADINEGIAWAEQVIDDYCGTSFEAKAFSVTLAGSGSAELLVTHTDGYPIQFIQSITSCSVDGTAVADVSGWGFYPTGVVVRDSGTFTAPNSTLAGPNVAIAGTAGITAAAPDDIAWCARTLARQYVLELKSKVPKRELTAGEQGGFGPIAHAGGVGRPTNLPDVNAVLSRNRHRPVVI